LPALFPALVELAALPSRHVGALAAPLFSGDAYGDADFADVGGRPRREGGCGGRLEGGAEPLCPCARRAFLSAAFEGEEARLPFPLRSSGVSEGGEGEGSGAGAS
jgi:hypothetical protein